MRGRRLLSVLLLLVLAPLSASAAEYAEIYPLWKVISTSSECPTTLNDDDRARLVLDGSPTPSNAFADDAFVWWTSSHNSATGKWEHLYIVMFYEEVRNYEVRVYSGTDMPYATKDVTPTAGIANYVHMNYTPAQGEEY